MAAKIKQNAVGRDCITFKTANPIVGSRASHLSKVIKRIAEESIEFTGVDITPCVREHNGNWKLYGRHHFVNYEGILYYWTGVDTENPKGFSIRITHVPEVAATQWLANNKPVFDLSEEYL